VDGELIRTHVHYPCVQGNFPLYAYNRILFIAEISRAVTDVVFMLRVPMNVTFWSDSKGVAWYFALSLGN
jgi:hypothetical protein